jgi:peptidyl-prolyl cis-trans isomerase D
MLRGIHKATSTWLGKAIMATVMGVLVISFAIWGIGDIFRGFGQNAVAEIGSTEISIEQFRQFYNERLQQLSRQTRRVITPDQARALGLDRQILGQLIAETAFNEQAQNMRLGLSDKTIAEHITKDPAFLGINGTFDHDRFEQIIRQAGFTEGRFVAEQRQVLLRRQIAQTVSGSLHVPSVAMQAINQFQNERRDIDYLTLGPAQAGEIPAPTPEQLSKYFDEHKLFFQAPEYRKVTLLTLSPATLAKPDSVSDTDAKNYFEQHKNEYGKPEKREVRQIVFPNEADAAAARERIVKGTTFDELAKERGLKPSDTDLGTVTKTNIIDPAVAEAAFSLKAGEVSQPVKGRFGIVLLTVGKIETGEQKAFADVEPQIKQQLAQSRARSEISDLRDKVEDERASGATLAETGKKLGLKAITIDAVDRAGHGPKGEPVPELANMPNVINAAFASDVGVDNEALQLPDGGYLYFDVNGITPSRARTLDEVKDQAASRWRDDEIARRLKTKADDMLGKLKSGTALAQVASENKLTVQTASNLQRGQATASTPTKLVSAAFATPKSSPGVAEGDNETQRFIFRVKEVTIPTFNANSLEGKQLASVLENSYADDLVGSYVARLESNLGVTINQAAFNQVIGGVTQ